MKEQILNKNYICKRGCQESRIKHRLFWRNIDLGIPLLWIKAKKELRITRKSLLVELSRKDMELSADWHLDQLYNQIYGFDFLFESMPVGNIMLGRDITNMGVLSGAEFHIHGNHEFIKFQQNIDFLHQKTPEFAAEIPFIKSVIEIYRLAIDKVGNAGFINPPTTADALSTAAMIMGESALFLAMKTEPQKVREKLFEINNLFYQFHQYIYQELLTAGYGEAASWFPVFAEGKFDSVRSDVSSMLSPQMFRDFSLPLIEKSCSYLDFSMFNLDSTKLIRFLDQLADIKKLNGIYWNIEPWEMDLKRFIPVLKHIKELGFVLALPCKDADDAKLAIAELGTQGLLLELPAFENTETAQKAGEEILAFC